MQKIDMTSLVRLYVSTTEQLEVYIVAPQFLERKRDPKNGSSEGWTTCIKPDTTKSMEIKKQKKKKKEKSTISKLLETKLNLLSLSLVP